MHKLGKLILSCHVPLITKVYPIRTVVQLFVRIDDIQKTFRCKQDILYELWTATNFFGMQHNILVLYQHDDNGMVEILGE